MDAGYARHAAAIGSASRVETQHIESMCVFFDFRTI
jgi:hypothetical protein